MAQPMHTRGPGAHAWPERGFPAALPPGAPCSLLFPPRARYSPRKPPLRPPTDTTRRLPPCDPAAPATVRRSLTPSAAWPGAAAETPRPGDPRRGCRAGGLAGARIPPGRTPFRLRAHASGACLGRAVHLRCPLGRGPRESAFIFSKHSSCRLLRRRPHGRVGKCRSNAGSPQNGSSEVVTQVAGEEAGGGRATPGDSGRRLGAERGPWGSPSKPPTLVTAPSGSPT